MQTNVIELSLIMGVQPQILKYVIICNEFN